MNNLVSHIFSLYYAQLRVGTPPISFMVALDMGSDISWLPCGCTDCAHFYETDKGQIKILNSYSPKSSSTSAIVSCDSPECWPKKQCPRRSEKACPYKVDYMSDNTSTEGILVKDVLHLETYDKKHRASAVPVIFGCGVVETGTFLEKGALNGLLGLGFNTHLDVPSMLASKGLVPNSFSLCFAFDGNGRIAFGDKGSSAHMKTPLDKDQEFHEGLPSCI
ncbi:unnamed protein product [Cuscuta epithymum]|uniref:Peptidase A1 domain-containing protein n=2 Tax=Cuscuta epithymum TaxID=186058 RepID=A0AAV0EJ69_9ASTE|nr:unnamed protein product [Cuscuta epithymum]